MSRRAKRLDYSKYSTTGEKVFISPSTHIDSPQASKDSLQVPVCSSQVPVCSSQESVGSPQASNDSPQVPVGSPQESVGSPQESVDSPREPVDSPQVHIDNHTDLVPFDKMADEKHLKELTIKELTCRQEIADYITDNALHRIANSLDLLNSCRDECMSLRRQFRDIHNNIKFVMDQEQYEKIYRADYETAISNITACYQSVVESINQFQIKPTATAIEVLNLQSELVIKEINRSLTSLKDNTKCVLSLLTNDEIKQRKSQLKPQAEELKEITIKIKELITLRPNMQDYNTICERYETLIATRSSYETKVENEIRLRELDKLETFKKSRLNINLKKFTGYDSETNIYTFIDEFEKLYSDSVPKNLQADMLKNNHLDKQALALVKNLSDIVEIWQRLKQVFGDKEILLQNKLIELYDLSIESKQKDPMEMYQFSNQNYKQYEGSYAAGVTT